MGILQILDIQDNHSTDIKLNTKVVHNTKGMHKIQVEKWLLEKYKDNALDILVRLQPDMLKNDGDNTDLDQIVDLPMQLINLLILGMSVKAHSIGVLTVDPRTGTPYNINPYIERYQIELKTAQYLGYLPAQVNVMRDVTNTYFV